MSKAANANATAKSVKYFTVNKFMDDMKDKCDVELVHLYFIPSHAFRNQYNNMSIKPVAMILKEVDNKPKTMKYDAMIQFLDCIPIISFKPFGDRRVYKKQQLQKLIIYNQQHASDKGQYYDSKILTVNDEKVIENIKADIPAVTNVVKHDDDTLDDLWIEVDE